MSHYTEEDADHEGVLIDIDALPQRPPRGQMWHGPVVFNEDGFRGSYVYYQTGGERRTPHSPRGGAQAHILFMARDLDSGMRESQLDTRWPAGTRQRREAELTSIVVSHVSDLYEDDRADWRAMRDEEYENTEYLEAANDPAISCPPSRGDFYAEWPQGGVAPWDRPRDGKTPPKGTEDRFTVRQKLAAWEKAATEAKALIAKYNIHLGAILGCGRYACAWEVQGDTRLVAKLTGDPSDAGAWAALRAYYDDSPAGIAQVYCAERVPVRVAGKRGSFAQAPARGLYFILQERLIPLSRKEGQALDHISYDLKVIAGVVTPIASAWGIVSRDEERRRATIVAYLKKQKLSPEAFEPLIDGLQFLRDEIGITVTDLHHGNVMKDKDGNYKIIDLGVSSGMNIDVPEMAGEAPQDEHLDVRGMARRTARRMIFPGGPELSRSAARMASLLGGNPALGEFGTHVIDALDDATSDPDEPPPARRPRRNT